MNFELFLFKMRNDCDVVLLLCSLMQPRSSLASSQAAAAQDIILDQQP